MVSPPRWTDIRRALTLVECAGRPNTRDGRPAYSVAGMDPHRKRTIRFTVALTCALLLAAALAYTSFSSASAARTPSELAADAQAGRTYQLTGKVAEGSWTRRGTVNLFRVRDRTGQTSVPVRYVGSVPDTFKDGREIVVDVRAQGAVFVGQKDTLVTKCPSKFTADKSPST